jgi:L-asparagine oxygenase
MGIAIYNDVAVDPVPPTPDSQGRDGIQTPTANQSILMHAALFGHPVGYAQEQNGKLIQDVFPVKGTETRQISTSSKTELALHTETAFHPYKPDYVLLLCLRGDENAETTFASIENILPYLSQHTIDTLQEEWFVTGIDESFRTHGEPDVEIPLSVLKRDERGWRLTYDATVMKGINEAADMALRNLEWAVSMGTQSIALKTGQLMVIDNNSTVHGRKPFQPRYDGTDRWLKRVLVVEELPPDSEYDNGVITTQFTSAS